MTIDKVFLRYVLAVVVNTLAGAGVMFVMYNFLHLGYWGSSALNYIAGSIIVFFINKYWTFKVRKWSIYMLVCYAANILLSYFLAFRIARTVIYFLLEDFTLKTRDHAALAVGMLLYVALNYIGQRYIVFAPRKIFSRFTKSPPNVPSAIAPVENHRERETGVLVYPVHSRRAGGRAGGGAGGLSVGINLFPDKKCCSFDCPYCEVFPFSTNAGFSLVRMENDLRAAIVSAQKQNVPIKDISFSGNGEPSLSPYFPEALKLADSIRKELVPSAELVLITNGAGLLQPHIFSLLHDAATAPSVEASSSALNIWLKLDAGTPGWYQQINRAEIPFEKLIAKIKEFTASAPVTIQTMLCAVDGKNPPPDEAQAWETLMVALTEAAVQGIRAVQIYGKARPAPEDPKAQKLPVEYLEQRAASLRRALALAKLHAEIPAPPVEVYP